jgi:hypothetical protein
MKTQYPNLGHFKHMPKDSSKKEKMHKRTPTAVESKKY